jgi:uncharacterized iron-regulated membrane protein
MATTAPLRPAAQGAAAVARPPRKRSIWWVTHSWVGLKLSLFMAWVLLTGTLAVFSVEMDWLARPALRVAPQDAPHASWGTLADAAQRAVPGGEVLGIYAPPHSWFAAEAMTKDAGDDRVRVYLNPYDGTVQGTGQWLSFQRFFREMHRHLLLPAKWGIPLVSSLSILILMSLVTGLVSYKKFWRSFLKRPRGGNARRLTGDLHRLGGLWSLWFVALIGLTGLWYLVESLGGDAPFDRAPKVEAMATTPLGAAAIDAYAETARRAYPTLTIRELRLPTEPDAPVGFFGQADALLVRDRANGVWIDPANGRVIQVVRGEAMSAHQRISEMADPLHFGTFGGMTTKILWFVFGAVLTALAVTGAIIYSMRLATAFARSDQALRRQGPIARLWFGMGRWAYPSAAIVIASLAMIPIWLRP